MYRRDDVYEEEMAAMRLLEILRRHHRKDDQETEEAKTSEYKSDVDNTTDSNEISSTTDEVSQDSITYVDGYGADNPLTKTAIRHSLAELINLYLNKLHDDSGEDAIDDNHIMHKRDLKPFEGHISLDQIKQNVQKRKHKKSKTSTVCNEYRRSIKALDRFEIDKSMENRTKTDFNIRKLLNYR